MGLLPLPLVAALALLASPPTAANAPKAAAKVVKAADPICAGGTDLKTEPRGSWILKFCARPNGERHGPFVKIYTATGGLQERGSYNSGKLHGTWSRWDGKSTLREQGEYHEGEKRGFWTSFHPNGKKATAGEFGERGKERGTWASWNEKGQLLEEGEYRAGQKHGFWTTYDPKSGKVANEIEYSHGVKRKR